MQRSRMSALMAMLLAGVVGAGIAGCDQGSSGQKTSRDEGWSEPPAKQSMAPAPPSAARGEESANAAKPAEGSKAGQDSAWAGAATQSQEQEKTGPMASPADEKSKDAAKSKEPS